MVGDLTAGQLFITSSASLVDGTGAANRPDGLGQKGLGGFALWGGGKDPQKLRFSFQTSRSAVFDRPPPLWESSDCSIFPVGHLRLFNIEHSLGLRQKPFGKRSEN